MKQTIKRAVIYNYNLVLSCEAHWPPAAAATVIRWVQPHRMQNRQNRVLS